MRLINTAIAFILLPAIALAAPEPAELTAIRIKENTPMYGPLGELGPYQMMPKTVQDAGGYDLTAAIRHLERTKVGLVRNGIEPTIYNIALVWNCGLKRVVNGDIPASTKKYAEDVDKLYRNLNK